MMLVSQIYDIAYHLLTAGSKVLGAGGLFAKGNSFVSVIAKLIRGLFHRYSD
jgi:hypothetical protein